MQLRKFYDEFKKSKDLKRVGRAAFEEGTYLCDACGHALPLANATALTFQHCPKCRFNVFIPYLLNDYLLFEPIGAGGVSSVYKALHRADYKNGVVYAAKIMRSDRSADENELKDFLYEAGVHQQVSSHPNIVRFIELGHDGGEYFHVMEYVPGESIKHRVENTGRITEIAAMEWLRQIVAALQHIEKKGYLYRDISPGNVLIRKDNSVCLIDFGLASSLEKADVAEEKRIIVGTPEYIPPERILCLGEDIRSSIYSLGMLLFFMIQGETLMKGTSNERTAPQHVASVRVAFDERMLPPRTSPKVVALIASLIQSDPRDRPSSFDEVMRMIDS